MGDRPLTDEERRVLDQAVEVVRLAGTGFGLLSAPTKVDCVELRCHPDDEKWVREMYDAPIAVDARVKPDFLHVVPHAYAKHINVTIGFVNPSDDEAGRLMAKRPLIAPFGIAVLVTRIKNGFRLRPVIGPHETGGTKIPRRPFRPQPRAGTGREEGVMDDAERTLRLGALLEAEEKEPERWWWLSFADGSLPAGQQFLGACMVKARGVATSVREAHRLGCNPGGEVRLVELPAHIVPPAQWANRLLTKAEAESDALNAALEMQGPRAE